MQSVFLSFQTLYFQIHERERKLRLIMIFFQLKQIPAKVFNMNKKTWSYSFLLYVPHVLLKLLLLLFKDMSFLRAVNIYLWPIQVDLLTIETKCEILIVEWFIENPSDQHFSMCFVGLLNLLRVELFFVLQL